MRPVTFLVAVLALAPLTHVTAQEPPPVNVGDRVRLTAPTLDIDKYDGTLRAMDRDTLIVDSLRVALLSVTRLDVHRGRKSNAGKGALVGGIVGGVLGGVAGAVLAGFCEMNGGSSQPASECRPAFMAVGTLAVGGFGALVGVVVGAGSTGDRWEEVSLDRLRVSFAPQRDGRFGLGLSVRF